MSHNYDVNSNRVLSAIPGSTNADKLAWIQARVTKHPDDLAPSPCACSCGGDCSGAKDTARAMSKALGEIEAVLGDTSYVILPGDVRAIANIKDIVAGVK
jgi:hypothetical protein